MSDAVQTPPAGLRARLARSRTAVRAWIDAASRVDVRFELTATVTLLLLLLHMISIWYMEAALLALCIPGLLFRGLLRRENFWFALTVVLAITTYREWFHLDNHKYLILYWVLAIACSRMVADADRTLAHSARLLIGLCFGFATIWKLISPDFASGTFFHYTLLTDSRFSEVATWLGGVPPEVLRANDDTLGDFFATGDALATVQLNGGPRLDLLAHVMTWWTIAIEGAIAVLFLLPTRFAASRWRDPFLILFVITTYSVAPVLGFAWVLCAMGVMQSDPRAFRGWPALYLVALLFVEVLPSIQFNTLIDYLTGWW